MLSGAELGLFFAFLTALLKGFQSLFQKKSALETDEYITGWSSRLFGLLILIPVNIYLGIPNLQSSYFLYIIPVGITIAATSVMIAKAYKISDVSIISPMFATGPVLVLITSFLILGEKSGPLGILGVFLTSIGVYFLKKEGSIGLLEPFRKLSKDRGVQIILLVVVIYSVTANVDKLGLKASSPLFWALSVYIISSLFMFPLVVKKSQNWKGKLQSSWKPLTVLGILGGAYISFQMLAFELTLVAHVSSVKRLSILVAVVGGSIIFDESSLKERLTGSAFMIAGTILIYLSTI